MAPSKTIIFGPTGNIGSLTAQAAHEHSSTSEKIVLAMRDPQKPLSGPLANLEQSKPGVFERVQADLTKSDTVSAAVRKTGAKHAFIYLAFGTQDHMRASIEALKSSGIDFVVFLSSFGVSRHQDLESIPPTDMLPYIHARVEINLAEVMGKGHYVSVRPAWFSSNVLRFKGAIMGEDGEVKMPYPEPKFDWLAPEDIGEVCGALLASRPPPDLGGVLELCGPKLLSQREAVAIIGKAIGKEIRVSAVDEQEALEIYINQGLAPPLASYLLTNLRQVNDGELELYPHAVYEPAVGNIRKYTGKEPLKFEQWVALNKERITGP